jgi:hypothetical protein
MKASLWKIAKKTEVNLFAQEELSLWQRKKEPVVKVSEALKKMLNALFQ